MPENCEIKIHFHAPDAESPLGYLRGISTYDPLPGEKHRRGRDLSDGRATEDTLFQIMDDIRAIMCGNLTAFERDYVDDNGEFRLGCCAEQAPGLRILATYPDGERRAVCTGTHGQAVTHETAGDIILALQDRVSALEGGVPSPHEPPTVIDGAAVLCSFCGKSSDHDCVKVLAGPTVFICEECVAVCVDILREPSDEAHDATLSVASFASEPWNV